MHQLPRAFSLLLPVLLVTASFGQCANDNTLSGAAVTVPCPGSISGGCILGGRYALINVTAGNVYTFSTCAAGWDTYVTLYNNAGGANVGFNNDGCNGTRSTVQWTASFTGQLRVLVDRANCTPGSNPCAPLWVTCGLNDDRCTASLLTVGSSCTNTVGTNVGASATSGVGNPSCSTYSGGDVWYRFVAPSTGNTVITTSTIGGSALTDGAMAVYSATSCSAAFTEVACNNNSPLGGNMPYIVLTGLTGGDTYYVRFWENGNNAFGTFNICAYDPTPVNDDPCAAIALPLNATCTNTASSNLAATSTAGVPAPTCGNYGGGDVWFTFTGPPSGQVTLATSTVGGSSLTDSGLAVYTATACAGTFTEVACNDDDPGGGLMSRLVVTGLTNGTTYYARVWEYGNNAFGAFNICATTPAVVGNDDPCSATSLTVGATCSNTTGTTAGSSPTLPAGDPSCGNYLGNDVWFTAVAPASGNLVVSTSTVGGSPLTDAAMAVFSAASCGAALTEVACNDNSPASNMPEIGLSGLTAGATYYIRVWANGNTTYGTFNICAFEPPVNDEPCGAIALTVGSSCTMVSRTNVSATSSSAPPLPGCGNLTGSSRDVWFTFVAPSSGIAVIQSTAGTLTDGSMALYSGSTCTASGLTLVQCSSDEGTGAMPFLRFADLVPGDTYYLRYWGTGSSSGTFDLCVWSPTMPVGNTCVYFLELFDSAENGWGSSAVQVQINGGAVVSYTVASGFYANALIGLNTNDLFQVSYVNTGPNQNQNRYQIRQVPGGAGVFLAGPTPASGISLFEVVDCVPPDPPREDCVGGVNICGGQTFNDNPAGTGFDVDLRYTTFGCLSAAERQGTWYKFTPSASGTIGMTIAPTDSGDDYDFAIWGPESGVICPPYRQPKRCSWSGNTGDTGMRTTSTDTTEDSSGDKWVAALDAQVGEIYLMYISNYSQSGLSFTLSWQLTNGAALDCLLLPVDFIDLQAELKGEQVEVTWSTASEMNAGHYVVERSPDAFDYAPIGTVQAMGNTTNLTTYSFLDDAPQEGLNYYRVQQVDADGAMTTSPADYVVYRKAATQMVVFPNPAGDILFASFEMPEDDAVIWRIVDAQGRLIEQDLYQGTKGNMLIDVPLERLSPGNYTLLVNDSRGRMNRSAHFVKH